MAPMSASCSDCAVRDRALCAVLSPQEIKSLGQLSRRRHLKAGSTLVWEGDDNAICGNLISGVLRVETSTVGGQAQTVALLYPADFVGRPYASDAGQTITALTDAELCLFTRPSFELALATFAGLENQLLRRTLQSLDDSRAAQLRLGRKGASARVADFLLDTAKRMAGGDCRAAAIIHRFDLPLTRGEIADVLGLTIETVSRQFTKLAKGGLIELEGRRGVVVRDPGRLAQLAEG